jgi:hypothetical protein
MKTLPLLLSTKKHSAFSPSRALDSEFLTPVIFDGLRRVSNTSHMWYREAARSEQKSCLIEREA